VTIAHIVGEWVGWGHQQHMDLTYPPGAGDIWLFWSGWVSLPVAATDWEEPEEWSFPVTALAYWSLRRLKL